MSNVAEGRRATARVAVLVGLVVAAGHFAFETLVLSRLAETLRDEVEWADAFVFGGIASAAVYVLIRSQRRHESRFRLLVQGLDAIFWEASNGAPGFAYVSPAAESKLGYPVSRWLSSARFWADIVHPDDRERVLAVRRALLAGGGDQSTWHRMVAADGRIVWFEDLVHVERDEAGRPLRFSGVMVDVTRRAEIQRDLEREVRVGAGLTELKEKLLQATSLKEICDATLEQARALTESPIGFVAQVERETGALVALSFTPEVCGRSAPPERVELVPSEGLMGWVAAHREPMLVNDLAADARASGKLPAWHLPVGRFLSVPALHGGELVGQIAVANAAREYDVRDVRVLQLLAPDVALAITRVRAQEALEESRAQLEAMVDSAMDAIVTADEEGRVVLFNAAAERLFGVGAADALGGSLDRFMPARFRNAHARHVGVLEEGALRPALSAITGLRADGTEFPIEASVSSVRIGGRRLSTAILRDVSDRRRSEEQQIRLQRAILQASDDWRRTFDAMPSAVVVLDGSGLIQRLNLAAAGALGGTYPQFVGRPLAEAGGGEPWTTAIRLAEGSTPLARTRVHDEASGRWWDVTVTRMPDRDGGDPRLMVAADDVTALVSLEGSIGRAEKMAAMGALTAGVAHEVRNPLFAIAASVDALGAVLRDQPKVTQLLDLMRQQVERMNQLMRELLVYGRPASANASAEEPLGPVVERALRACAPLAEAAGVSLVLEGDPGGFVVRGDASRLEEVIVNLLENAVQHSRRGTGVRLAVSEHREGDEEWVRCSVTDDGPGFRREDLAKVFEPFFTRRSGGTGLGLSIVQRIVEQHRGRVAAANGPGGGACVTVELPCAAARAGAPVA